MEFKSHLQCHVIDLENTPPQSLTSCDWKPRSLAPCACSNHCVTGLPVHLTKGRSFRTIWSELPLCQIVG